MNIDLFTFLIQIVNFLVLLFILDRILIKPLLKSVDERRKNIIKQNEEITTKQEELNNYIELYEAKIAEFENFKLEETRKLNLEIQEQKNSKNLEIQEEFNKERSKFMNKFMSERDSLVEEIINAVCLKMPNLLEKIFLDLTDEELEDKIIKKFIFQLKDSSEIKKIDKDTKIHIYSAFELSIDNKELIMNFFKNLGFVNEIDFIRDNNLILGIKLEAENIVINSNISNIIEQFNSLLKKSL